MVKRWTQKEEQILRECYLTCTSWQLEKMLGRTGLAIWKKAQKLALGKNQRIEYLNRCNRLRRAFSPGKSLTKKGYVYIDRKGIKGCGARGKMLEHRKVMQEHIGRTLSTKEAVHHIDGNKQNNDIKNLILLYSREHTIMHHLGATRKSHTKLKISLKALERYKDKRNHPSYLDIKDKVFILKKKGKEDAEIAKEMGICIKTVSNKLKEMEKKHA